MWQYETEEVSFEKKTVAGYSTVIQSVSSHMFLAAKLTLKKFQTVYKKKINNVGPCDRRSNATITSFKYTMDHYKSSIMATPEYPWQLKYDLGASTWM